MGYMRHKYTRPYFLKEDSAGNPTIYGNEGVQDYKKGSIRGIDRDILRRLDFRGKDVLDVGFGRGEAIKFAVDNGAVRVTGVDFSRDAYDIAREFLDRYGIHADLYCDEALSYFKSYTIRNDAEPFDIVLMLDVVEHIPRSELSEILKLMHNLLSDRAVIAINTPVFRVDNDVIAEGLNPRARDTSDDFDETAGMHCNRFTKRSLQSYMRNSGFIAISGHLFLANLSIALPLEGSRFAWWKAFKTRYPILLSALWWPERFTHAASWEEVRKREKSRLRRVLRFPKRVVKAVLRRIGFRGKPVEGQ